MKEYTEADLRAIAAEILESGADTYNALGRWADPEGELSLLVKPYYEEIVKSYPADRVLTFCEANILAESYGLEGDCKSDGEGEYSAYIRRFLNGGKEKRRGRDLMGRSYCRLNDADFETMPFLEITNTGRGLGKFNISSRKYEKLATKGDYVRFLESLPPVKS